MESKEAVVRRRIRAYKNSRVRTTRRSRPRRHGNAEPEARLSRQTITYGVREFLIDQRCLLRQGDEDPGQAVRVDGAQQAYLRVPTRKILSALARPSAAKLFIRRYQGRGWDQFLRFRRVVRFIQERKEEIARCGLGVTEPWRALVSEEFVAFLLSRPLARASAEETSLTLTTYIARHRRPRP